MINLLPLETKKLLEHEYRLRVLVLGLLAATGALGFATVLLFAQYLYLEADISRYEEMLAVVWERNAASRSAEVEKEALLVRAELEEASRFLVPGPVLPSYVIERVLARAPLGVTLSTFSHERISQEAGAPSKMQVSGVAGSREALLLFAKQLREDPLFSSVDAPISLLAPRSKISFTITLTLVQTP